MVPCRPGAGVIFSARMAYDATREQAFVDREKEVGALRYIGDQYTLIFY